MALVSRRLIGRSTGTLRGFDSPPPVRKTAIPFGGMGLVAVLSNIQTEARFQRLTRRDWRQVRRPSPGTRDRARDGKLKFGTVSGAVLAVLAEARSPLRYIEIHARVCEL